MKHQTITNIAHFLILWAVRGGLFGLALLSIAMAIGVFTGLAAHDWMVNIIFAGAFLFFVAWPMAIAGMVLAAAAKDMMWAEERREFERENARG